MDAPKGNDGVMFYFRGVKIKDLHINLEICDTPSLNFEAVAMSELEDATAVLVVFDLSNEASFTFAQAIVKKLLKVNVDVFLVANKCDFKKEVTEKKIKSFSK
mmetsp:Transcript_8389/g.7462  ORF Transcript_8389/g.7462 Transcript_8389/m.7462 type:complete len:103 (+) Transcript_8389:1111-1419(+)